MKKKLDIVKLFEEKHISEDGLMVTSTSVNDLPPFIEFEYTEWDENSPVSFGYQGFLMFGFRK